MLKFIATVIFVDRLTFANFRSYFYRSYTSWIKFNCKDAMQY